MLLLLNKKARFDYTIAQTYQAGVILTGGEVKSLRNKSGSLTGSFVKVIGDELFLLNAQITPYKFADTREYDPKRTRKLLLKRKEIIQLKEWSEQKGAVLVPLSFEVAGRNIKLTLGVGRGKKQFEKRAELRRKDVERDVQREMKGKIRVR
ncbi:MAG TPA: SsrA-binding protein SmpB [Vitreimonas sp.]|nr:SsrA-binding protein SmpB [Vitreimonas sp.]